MLSHCISCLLFSLAQALQAVRALLAEATATEPSDALMQGLRSTLKLLLLLWRDLEVRWPHCLQSTDVCL
jgi:hypothetical protein